MKIFLKFIFVIVIILHSFEVSYSQSTVWRQIIGGPSIDISYNCIESKYGGYLATGFKQIMPSGSTSYISQSFITKFDNYGNILWDKLIGDSLTGNLSLTLIEDSLGNIYLPYSLAGYAHLAKLDFNGNILWDKDYFFNNILYFRGISFVDQYKNLLLLSQNNVQQFNPTSGITKIDSSGNLIWTKPYYDSIPSFSYYTSHNNSFFFTNNSYFISGSKGVNSFIIKTDTSGNIIWNKRYLFCEGLYSIAQNSENTFIALGRAGFSGYIDCMKFDSSGNIIWNKDFRNDTLSYGIGWDRIIRNFEGNFVLGTSSGENVARLLIIDSVGVILSSKYYYYPPGFYIAQNNINNTSDSGYIVAGRLDSNNIVNKNNHLGNNQIDILIFKIDKNGKTVSIKNDQIKLIDDLVFNTYPNPYNLSFNIAFYLSRSSKVKIVLFNLLGKKVKEIENLNLSIGYHHYMINTPELSSGVYFLKTEINNELHLKRILLIK